MEIAELSTEIKKILENYNSPERLSRHLRIVSHTTSRLLAELSKEWSQLKFDKGLVQFGAMTHDIGKVILQEEIYAPGKEHEQAGKDLLIQHGYSEEQSRFAYTHGNWKNETVRFEDLLVALADKIWKGKRVAELEEKVCALISNQLELDYWEVYQTLEPILDEIGLAAQERLNWQNASV